VLGPPPRRALPGIVALLVLILLVSACGGGSDDGAASDTAGGEQGAAAPGEADAGGGLGRGAQAPDVAAPAAPGEPAGEQQPPALPDLPPASTGERIIKQGMVSLEVDEGGYEGAFSRLVAAATRLGGTVVATTSISASEGVTSGSVTLRVPAENYEQLLVAVGEIGRVRRQQVSAQDVGTEYVDLQSRLTHLQAQERFYLALIDRAQTIGDAIAIQQQLESLQSQLEQVKGRIRYLDERTAFSTLTVELLEPGASLPASAEPGARPTLARYWANATDAFVHVIGGMLVVVFFLAPLTLPAALLLAAWWAWRRRRRPGHAAPAAQPAAPEASGVSAGAK
jgi:hypothetical protein